MKASELASILNNLPNDPDVMLGVNGAFLTPVFVDTRNPHTVLVCNFIIERYQHTITCEGVEYESVQRTWGRGRE